MILEQIKIKNFLPFKDETVIEFAKGTKKNITILLAENNVGKSSLVKAFVWCLYGHDKQDKNDVLNDETEADLLTCKEGAVAETHVAIRLIHEKITYVIYREWKFTLAKNKRLDKAELFKISTVDEDGNSKSVQETDKEARINRILPEDLAEYFFYEEKKFNEIGNTKNIKKSVENFCGLTTQDNAIVDIDKAMALINKDQKTENDSVFAKRIKDRADLDYKINFHKGILNTAQEQTDYYFDAIKKENQKLVERAKDEAEAKTYKSLQKHYEAVVNDQPCLINEVVKKFNDNIIGYLANDPAFQNTITLLDNLDDGDGADSIVNLTTGSIDQIIKRGRCICGCKIVKDENDVHYQHLMQEWNKVPPNSMSGVVKNYKAQLSDMTYYSRSYYGDVIKTYKEAVNNQADINETEFELDKLKDKISKYKDAENIRAKLQEMTEKYHVQLNKKEKEVRDIATWERDIEDLDKKIETSNRLRQRNIEVQNCMDVAKNVKQVILNELTVKREAVLKEMNHYVGKYFSDLYHGNRSLIIDENYNITTLNDYNGAKLSSTLSSGTNDVKNFAFVFGLEQLAKDKMAFNSDDEDEFEEGCQHGVSEPYPLILDGPFSHTDRGHIENLCKLLPDISNQVIIAVSNKDWGLTKDYLEDKVEMMYQMKVISEEHTSIVKIEK